jgi:hypothetical protein
MSDELTALQETAAQLRAKADEVKATLTDASSNEERATADEAEKAATDAESVFAEAQAKAEADAAAATAEAEAKAKADADAEAQAKAEADAAAQGGAGADEGTGEAPDANESRTGFVDKGFHSGDACICPDGRKGTVHSFDAGLICIPNHDQG